MSYMPCTPYANEFPSRGSDAPNEVHWFPYEYGKYVYRAICPSANLTFKVERERNRHWSATALTNDESGMYSRALVLATGRKRARDAMNAVENFADNLAR